MPRPVDRLLDLTGRSVLVTGASGGIGAAIAARLVEAGARVAVHYRRDEAGAQALCETLGEAALPLGGELSEPESVAALFATLDSRGFELDGLVNNAADQSLGALDALTASAWDRMRAGTLDSAFLVSQAATARMSEGGAIVNVSSIESFDPAVAHGHYATAKAGLNMLTRAFALEFGGRGIRANAVAPGLVARPGIAEQWPEGVERWQSRAPLGRMGAPDEVADAVLFLLSDAARWISGSVLTVDGGMTAQGRW